MPFSGTSSPQKNSTHAVMRSVVVTSSDQITEPQWVASEAGERRWWSQSEVGDHVISAGWPPRARIIYGGSNVPWAAGGISHKIASQNQWSRAADDSIKNN